ncbi:MAG: hypothetical protein AB1405_06760 [Bdellovibrionota bacterium]
MPQWLAWLQGGFVMVATPALVYLLIAIAIEESNGPLRVMALLLLLLVLLLAILLTRIFKKRPLLWRIGRQTWIGAAECLVLFIIVWRFAGEVFYGFWLSVEGAIALCVGGLLIEYSTRPGNKGLDQVLTPPPGVFPGGPSLPS